MSHARIHAMISQCKNRGGCCNCVGVCKAEVAVKEAVAQKDREVGRAKRELEETRESLTLHLNSPQLQFKEGFTPEPGKRYAIYLDGEDSDFGHIDESGEFIPEGIWPFNLDYAYAPDCRRLGIETV